jgi:hypothetical protein
MGLNWGGAAAGAAGGASMGPWGAAAGGLLGLFGGGGSQSQMPELDAFTWRENELNKRGYNLTRDSLSLLRADPRKMRAKFEGAFFNPMASQIKQGYAKGRASDRVAMFGRGQGGSSQQERAQRQGSVDMAGALSNAKYQSIIGGEGMFQNHQQGLRANAGLGQGIMDAQANNRLGRSGVTTTNNESGLNVGAGMFGMGMMSGGGYDWLKPSGGVPSNFGNWGILP